MSGLFEMLGRRALFAFDAEQAHGLSIAGLKTGLVTCAVPADPALAVKVAGLQFPNPLGMAAGYDKNAEVPDALLKLGFGFAEVGTITPRPQAGNPRPRIFRLPEDRAVINRLGFNNEGHDAAFKRLSARAGKSGIVGVNIGANKDAEDRIADYVAGIRRFYQPARYFTVNISSPNTPGLRNLQARGALHELLSRVLEARDEESGKCTLRRPVFLKIAPDLADAELDDIAAEAIEHHRPLKTSPRLEPVLALLRSKIAPLTEDRYLAPDLAAATEFVMSGAVGKAAGLDSFAECSA